MIPREARWAFARAVGRNGTRRDRPDGWRTPGVVLTAYGVTVVRSSRVLPYGRSTHRASRLTHLVDGVYTAWRSGRLVGTLVRWRCGQETVLFRLFSATTQAVCLMCLAATQRAASQSPSPLPTADPAISQRLVEDPQRNRARLARLGQIGGGHV